MNLCSNVLILYQLILYPLIPPCAVPPPPSHSTIDAQRVMISLLSSTNSSRIRLCQAWISLLEMFCSNCTYNLISVRVSMNPQCTHHSNCSSVSCKEPKPGNKLHSNTPSPSTLICYFSVKKCKFQGSRKPKPNGGNLANHNIHSVEIVL